VSPLASWSLLVLLIVVVAAAVWLLSSEEEPSYFEAEDHNWLEDDE